LGVRPFAVEDIPQVSDLWWKTLRKANSAPPPTLSAFFEELYFKSPLADAAMPSLVYEQNGKIVGFLGVVRRRVLLRGQPIRVAFGGNFVVQPEARSSLAGLRLLSDYRAGQQDLSQTDSANDISKNLLERLGFRTIIPLSVHWSRPLRPARFGVDAIGKFLSPTVSASLRFAATPVTSVLDSMAAKLSFSPFRQSPSPLSGAELDLESLLHCLSEFRGDGALQPEYDADSLKWLLSFMERMHPHAQLRKVLVRDTNRKIVGWYIYFVKAGIVADVVQMGGRQQHIPDLLGHFFHDAWSQGASALHGIVPLNLMGDFSQKNCIFACRGGWNVAYSRNQEILELLTRGDCNFSRLDGEWCLNIDA
jgi:hypothetical protein